MEKPSQAAMDKAREIASQWSQRDMDPEMLAADIAAALDEAAIQYGDKDLLTPEDFDPKNSLVPGDWYEKMKAERDRYRAALNEIRALPHSDIPEYRELYARAVTIARTALGGEGG